MSRKAGERSENQINRVYDVIVFHSRTFIQKVTFWGNGEEEEEKLFRLPRFLLRHHRIDGLSDRSKIILLIFRLLFRP